jgi:DNA-binding beta-propeller fold protein YncE
LNYPPHYLFSIYGVDKPVGVAVSPDGDRIYVAESGGERLIKTFNRDGEPMVSFAPPLTSVGERAPVYVATDGAGRVFVTDRLQHSVFVYDASGSYLDTILSPDLTLSEYLAIHTGGLEPGTTFAYNLYRMQVYYGKPPAQEKKLPAPDTTWWSPLGIRITEEGRMLLTDVVADDHKVHLFSSDALMADSWAQFDPQTTTFGKSGQGDGQFLYPNTAVMDSKGRIYVTDGNNGRVSAWDDKGEFLFTFGRGTGQGAINLPRGAAMDRHDRLHVVDAVGQNVKVYDVSGPEPSFLFTFGEWGEADGEFNYPNDIALDTTGRLYITDRENNRVQVWSY